jgi:hypothetical protein
VKNSWGEGWGDQVCAETHRRLFARLLLVCACMMLTKPDPYRCECVCTYIVYQTRPKPNQTKPSLPPPTPHKQITITGLHPPAARAGHDTGGRAVRHPPRAVLPLALNDPSPSATAVFRLSWCIRRRATPYIIPTAVTPPSRRLLCCAWSINKVHRRRTVLVSTDGGGGLCRDGWMDWLARRSLGCVWMFWKRMAVERREKVSSGSAYRHVHTYIHIYIHG